MSSTPTPNGAPLPSPFEQQDDFVKVEEVESVPLYEEDPEGALQATVDSLVQSARVGDVLFVLFYLSQLRGVGELRRVNEISSVEGAAALTLAVTVDSPSHRLIVQLLLLSGAHLDQRLLWPDEEGHVWVTEWARETWELWELGLQPDFNIAQNLLEMNVYVAEHWLEENKYEWQAAVAPGPADTPVFRPNPTILREKRIHQYDVAPDFTSGGKERGRGQGRGRGRGETRRGRGGRPRRAEGYGANWRIPSPSPPPEAKDEADAFLDGLAIELSSERGDGQSEKAKGKRRAVEAGEEPPKKRRADPSPPVPSASPSLSPSHLSSDRQSFSPLLAAPASTAHTSPGEDRSFLPSTLSDSDIAAILQVEQLTRDDVQAVLRVEALKREMGVEAEDLVNMASRTGGCEGACGGGGE
ncbi:hypothetical protein JCM10213_005469 [Rhodosporidiobolus nylandii]